MAPPARGGGSFLGTAAAAAAGVVGGGLLLGGIRSMMGGEHGAGSGGLDRAGTDSHGSSPWGGGNAGGELSREAGVNDIGATRQAAADTGDGGYFGGTDDAPVDQPADDYDAGGFDNAGGFDSDSDFA